MECTLWKLKISFIGIYVREFESSFLKCCDRSNGFLAELVLKIIYSDCIATSRFSSFFKKMETAYLRVSFRISYNLRISKEHWKQIRIFPAGKS